ncbi:hypothetical protein AXF42_Ash001062 [Apostasia shenzhenica]|uniref:Uncharacterized protein n=1 Tax=Apostasia shenzhenica TaxID=1088818 RepID=A0A2I0ATU0_9ASPA|nr:hypothetical protein AXF42_Ash001062 [Apostasia shenzhenica]
MDRIRVGLTPTRIQIHICRIGLYIGSGHGRSISSRVGNSIGSELEFSDLIHLQ